MSLFETQKNILYIYLTPRNEGKIPLARVTTFYRAERKSSRSGMFSQYASMPTATEVRKYFQCRHDVSFQISAAHLAIFAVGQCAARNSTSINHEHSQKWKKVKGTPQKRKTMHVLY